MFRRSHFYISSGQVPSEIRTPPLTWRNVAREIWPLWKRNWKIGGGRLIEWLLAVTLSKEPNLHFVRKTSAASCTRKCFEFVEAKSGQMTPWKWPSFPFQISTNRVRDRLSGIAIVEIFQPLIEPQTKEREREEGKRKRRYSWFITKEINLSVSLRFFLNRYAGFFG